MADERPTACVAFKVEPELRAEIDAACRVVEPVRSGPRREELLKAVADAEGLLIANAEAVDAALFEAAPRLRVVSGFGVGYDNVDLEAARAHDVLVCNTPGVLNAAVTDLVFGLLLAASRQLFENAAWSRDGEWARSGRSRSLGFDLAGRVLGVVGFGRIGREVTRRAHAFGMRTLYCDIFEGPPPDAPASKRTSLEDLLTRSDVVTLHTDLNPSSLHLMSTAEFALMKPTAWLVNTSRGPVVDQEALVTALEMEEIAGALVDVLEREPPGADEPLLALPNVIATPHVGTATVETRYAMRELSVRNLLAGLAGERPPACVNPELLG